MPDKQRLEALSYALKLMKDQAPFPSQTSAEKIYHDMQTMALQEMFEEAASAAGNPFKAVHLATEVLANYGVVITAVAQLESPELQAYQHHLNLSNGHLTEAAALLVWQWGSAKDFAGVPDGVIVHNHAHGGAWVWWDGEPLPDVVPVSFVNVMRFAQECGCDTVLFDQDGPVIPQLQLFDW